MLAVAREPPNLDRPVPNPPLARVLEPEIMESEAEARAYDAMDHGEVNARFVDDLLALAPDLGRVLDVGCGSAQIPIELCRRAPSARVLGVELGDAMIALARANVERAALSGVIRVDRADAKSLPYRDGSQSCVVSNSLVHHVPEPAAAFGEMARVLAGGGSWFVRDLLRPAGDDEVQALVARHAAGASTDQRALFDASLRAALTVDEVRALVAPLGVPASAVTQTSDRHWTLAWR